MILIKDDDQGNNNYDNVRMMMIDYDGDNALNRC